MCDSVHMSLCLAYRRPQKHYLFKLSAYKTGVSMRQFKAKSGNLNLFLRILPFFPLFSLQFSGKKGQDTQKKV